MPTQPVSVTPGRPTSAKRRHVRQARLPVRARDRQAANGAGADLLHHHRKHLDDDVDRAAEQIVERGRPALVGHVHHLDAGLLHEQLRRQIVERADAGRAEAELAGPRPGVGDELLHRLHRQLVVDHHGGGVFGGAGDRHEVARRVERRLGVDRIADHGRADRPGHDRVAVRLRLEHLAQAEHAVGARLVLHHDGLAEPRPQPVADDARRQIGDAGRRKRHHHADRVRRIRVRSRRGGRQQERDQESERQTHDGRVLAEGKSTARITTFAPPASRSASRAASHVVAHSPAASRRLTPHSPSTASISAATKWRALSWS